MGLSLGPLDPAARRKPIQASCAVADKITQTTPRSFLKPFCKGMADPWHSRRYNS